jgi:hypothetical protein
MAQLRERTSGVVGETINDHCCAAGTIPFKASALNTHVCGGVVKTKALTSSPP